MMAFMGIPLAFLLVVSFATYDSIAIVKFIFTIENYTRFLTDSWYLNILWYTVKLSLVVTFFCFLLGYPVAYYLARTDSKWKGTFIFLLIIPMMVGVVVRTYGWMVLLGSQGLIADVFHVKLLGTTSAVVIGIVEVLLPFMIIPLLSALERISPSIEEAAHSLGASKTQTFFRITFRLSLPGIISGSLLVFSMTMSSIITPKLLGSVQDRTMGVIIYDTMLSFLNWPFASAMSFIMFAFTFFVIYAYLNIMGRSLETRRN